MEPTTIHKNAVVGFDLYRQFIFRLDSQIHHHLYVCQNQNI